jgi:hypothetical protein
MALIKAALLACLFNITLCFAISFIDDDLLSYPHYKVVLTKEKVPKSQVFSKDVEVKQIQI